MLEVSDLYVYAYRNIKNKLKQLEKLSVSKLTDDELKKCLHLIDNLNKELVEMENLIDRLGLDYTVRKRDKTLSPLLTNAYEYLNVITSLDELKYKLSKKDTKYRRSSEISYMYGYKIKLEKYLKVM